MDVATTLGSMLMGGFVASMLDGIVAIQAVYYFRTYQSDGPTTKALVLGVWILDLIHTTFIWVSNWDYIVKHWGNTDNIAHIPSILSLTVVITALVTFMVHCFFAHRIFMLSKRNWLFVVPVLVLAATRLGAACVSTSDMLRYKSFPLFVIHAKWIFTLGLSVSSAVDILIAGLLFYLFNRNRRPESGHLRTVIDLLTLYTLETGGLTTLGTVVSMICWVTMSSNLIFLGLHFAIGKLYALSLLVTLNTREHIRRARHTSSAGRSPVVFLDTRAHKDSGAQYFSDPATRTEVQINVERSVTYDLGRSVTMDQIERK
ncbi:hypothetical protein HMN09_00408200 [Mycena chlorophos]|uniref:DUF6534 domain-containing protein n=1 Tax=Mycena chlorophos TaxID=658473 RepID=A0A8H6THE8_MYCCL|nr:hypothetical protein HMN09_00408200 [Mycena chlorophos]